VTSEQVASDRVLTVPNALSFLRLLGVPLFLWLALGPKADGWAIVVLIISSFTDWLDGKLARLLHQTSRLGQLLDPAADRLYIFATVLALSLRHIMPWWLAGVLIARDIVLAGFLPVLKRHGYGPLPVHYLGKAATFNLLYALPLLLLGDGHETVNHVARIIGWAFAIWGTALYWWAGGLYAIQVRQLVRADRFGFPPSVPGGLDQVEGATL
jgi:cardiolipin synthase